TRNRSIPVRRAIQLRPYVPSPLSVIFRRRQLVPLIAACRTCRYRKLGGVNPELVVLVTAATTFTVSPSRNRGTRLVTSNRAAGSVTSTSSVSLRYTFTSVTVTVWRLASTTVPSWGESWSTRQPWDLESSRTSTACCARGSEVAVHHGAELLLLRGKHLRLLRGGRRALAAREQQRAGDGGGGGHGQLNGVAHG